MPPVVLSGVSVWLLCLILHLSIVNSFKETAILRSKRHVDKILNNANHITRYRHRLMMNDEGIKDIGSMSVEELVTLADNEMELKLLSNQEELNQKKREIIQKKKDKLYEKYWEQRSKSTSTNSEFATFNQYYGIMASNGTYNSNNDKNSLNYNIEPISPRQNMMASASAIAVISAGFLAKFISRPTSASSRISTRMVKVEYPIEKLFAETKKVVLNKEILGTLPGLNRSILSSLRLFRGRLPSFSTDKVNVIVYWNPMDKVSVAAVNRIEMFTKEYPSNYNFITIVSSNMVDSIPSNAVPSNILVDDTDPTNNIMVTLGISALPTVMVCTSKDNTLRVIFSTEGVNTCNDVTGRCLAAVATVLSSSIEDAPTYAELQRTWKSIK